MNREEADKSFDLNLKNAPTQTQKALVWVRDTVMMARRMLEAEGLEVTTSAVVDLVRIVDGREWMERNMARERLDALRQRSRGRED